MRGGFSPLAPLSSAYDPNKKSLCQIAYSEKSSIENWPWEATK